MTKDDTLVIKGVAILMMLFLHLFNNADNVELCRCYFYIDGIPLVSYLERSTGSVACFLILSGYGMWIVNEKRDQNRVNRVLKLMLHYWLIMLIAVGVGSFILPQKYPGTFGDIVGNITSFSTSYNDHWWFLFPYLCLSLSSLWLFKYIREIRPKLVLATTFFIGILISFMISHYRAQYIYRNHLLYNFILYFHLMFPFLLGAMSARYNLLDYNIFSNFKITNGGYSLGPFINCRGCN